MTSRALALLLALAYLPAQAADTPHDPAKILAQMRQASGGEAWDTVHTLQLTTRSQDKVLYTYWQDLTTGRYLADAARPQYRACEGFDGITSWRQGMSGIAYTLGDIDAALAAANESYRVARAWWYPSRHTATIAWLGEKAENARRFDVLSITPEGGRPFEAWIDEQTHLLAKIDEQRAEDRQVTTFADYRAVRGILLPFAITSGDGEHKEFDETETLQSVDINPQIPDKLYSIPDPSPVAVEWPDASGHVELPFRITANNRIMVPLTVDGVKIEAEFDTGGSLLLQPHSVAQMGATATGHQPQHGGGEGVTTSWRGRVNTVSIGSVKLHDMAFHSFAFNPDAPDEALIGLEVLQRFVVHLDFDRQVMTLSDPQRFAYHGDGQVIPFHFQDNQPEVKGAIDGIAGLFAIDSGDNSSLLLIAPFARRYNLAERYHADIPYDGKAVMATHGVWARQRAGTVALFGADGHPAVAVHDPVTRLSLQQSGFDANRNVSANIGLGILKQFNLTFDYSRREIIFEPNHFYGQRDVFNRTGFRVERKKANWVITNVYPTGPANEAGIKMGDIIETVNGLSAAKLVQEDFDRLQRGPDGSSLHLRLRSATTSRALSLTLHDIF
jgi:hypothetical protein